MSRDYEPVSDAILDEKISLWEQMIPYVNPDKDPVIELINICLKVFRELRNRRQREKTLEEQTDRFRHPDPFALPSSAGPESSPMPDDIAPLNIACDHLIDSYLQMCVKCHASRIQIGGAGPQPDVIVDG